ISGQCEEDGYGLYSYLLFSSPPRDTARERYRQAIAAYLDTFRLVDEYAVHFRPAELNITYLPLRRRPATSRPSVNWVLENYDYARAGAFLAKLTTPHLEGPYIVSHLNTPLSETSVVNLYLDQDLSSVPARLVALWVKDFEARVGAGRSW